jgi:hypothetical protein
MITGSEPDVVAEAWWLTYAAGRDPHVARLLDRLVDELHARVRTLAEDRPPGAGLVADQVRLLARMSQRYAAKRSHPAAAWMLAAIHRLTANGSYFHAV